MRILEWLKVGAQFILIVMLTGLVWVIALVLWPVIALMDYMYERRKKTMTCENCNSKDRLVVLVVAGLIVLGALGIWFIDHASSLKAYEELRLECQGKIQAANTMLAKCSAPVPRPILNLTLGNCTDGQDCPWN